MATVRQAGSRLHRARVDEDRRRPYVLDEDQFGLALTRERYRSDRSRRPFGLLVFTIADETPPDSSRLWETTIGALSAATRDTDVAGWLEWPVALGVIVSEITVDPLAACRAIQARFQRELATFVEGSVGRVSVRSHVYPEPRHGGEEEPWSVDPLLYPELRARRERRTAYDAVKRSLDIIGSGTLLLLLSPLFLVIAALVKSGSRGPVFFRQERIGQMMKPFTMFKFRTMYLANDHRVHREFVSSFIKASGGPPQSGENGCFKLTNDPRVTPAGRLLRSTSLDELPQLWNVLRGEMSLVGPRPPLVYELEEYELWHRRRVLESKPGITGLWQVVGRSRTTFDEMVRLDLQYARTRSLWTDLKILLATPAAVISRKGAY